jgi:hypothetical protein
MNIARVPFPRSVAEIWPRSPLGRKWMTAVAFPMAFLVFMAPLPDGIVNWHETISNLTSTEAAALLFGVAGTPVLRDGNRVSIARNRYRSCAGMQRYPIRLVLFITRVLASYLFLKAPCRRAVVIALVFRWQSCAIGSVLS